MLIGLDDFTAGQPEIPAQKQPDSAVTTLLIQHSPGYFAPQENLISRYRPDLCFSGHTHGGQITLLGFPIWNPAGSGPFSFGFYDTPLCRLYVSRGIGTSLLPIRFGARPEVAVFDI
jgi:predicted MPP superfamily phosphohydrolase